MALNKNPGPLANEILKGKGKLDLPESKIGKTSGRKGGTPLGPMSHLKNLHNQAIHTRPKKP